MSDVKSNYLYMVQDGGEVGTHYGDLYNKAQSVSILDKKTFQFVYIAYLAAHGILSGLRKHVIEAKALGASREEIQAVILAGLPVGGANLADSYRTAMECFDEE